MSFLESAKARYSVRNFEDRTVEPEDMQKILEAANHAPTACNLQPQRIYVVQSEENIAKLNSLCKCIFGAKTVLMFTYNTDEEWKNPLEDGVRSGVEDVSIVATHVMMEAWELGIGSCWVNSSQTAGLKKHLKSLQMKNLFFLCQWVTRQQMLHLYRCTVSSRRLKIL